MANMLVSGRGSQQLLQFWVCGRWSRDTNLPTQMLYNRLTPTADYRERSKQRGGKARPRRARPVAVD